MISYRKEKIINSILYLSDKYYKKLYEYPTLEWLINAFCLIDFDHVKKHGIPCFGLKYEVDINGNIYCDELINIINKIYL
jgi:hypothetical protein